MDCDGVALDVIGADVGDHVADLGVHIALALLELVGEVLRSLVGEVDALNLVGNVNVIYEILCEQIAVGDELIHLTEVLRRKFLAVREGREGDAGDTESACLKDSGYRAGVNEVDAYVYTAVDAREDEIVFFIKT